MQQYEQVNEFYTEHGL